MFKFKEVYTVRLVYKSGYTHDFDVTSFKITGDTCEWVSVSVDNNPLRLGLNDIAAIWQVGTKRVFKFW